MIEIIERNVNKNSAIECYHYHNRYNYGTKNPTMNCEGTLSLNRGDKVSVLLHGTFKNLEDTETNYFEGLLYKRL